ncbi:unnamed protein product [Parnassius mnemosyne]|uniref:J domain-containing protein n=1 Tax=Parnassius mnemosyne TaxID=213953 RepID=A0AAV1KC38_9NEOP
MNKTLYSGFWVKNTTPCFFPRRTLETISKENIEKSFKVLNLPLNSNQDEIRKAFLELAKKYHPDSGSPDANIEKFVAIENAFRLLSKHYTGVSNNKEVEKIVFDIRHTAPQHRQYLSYEGVGYGTPSQRQRQWTQSRAQRAAANVIEHRISKAVASDKALIKKDKYSKIHDIKTKYGFDRLVEDLIQESISKGEFENLSGKGKPLKDQNTNPYVDFTTHKLNEVLINNGFTPEWITMRKEIDQDIEMLKEEIKRDRMALGPFPLNEEDKVKWEKVYESNKNLASSINLKINTYNLIVPMINKQKFHVEFDKICEDILQNGAHTAQSNENVDMKRPVDAPTGHSDDFISILFSALGELLTFKKEEKKSVNN